MPDKLLVIGWGNPYRGDDGAGFRIAQVLGGIAVPQLTPELAEKVAAADCVFFVDADLQLKPGTWHVEHFEPPSGASLITHSCTPWMLLALSTALYSKSPKAILIRIGATRCEHSEELTPEVASAIEQVVAYVREYSSASI